MSADVIDAVVDRFAALGAKAARDQIRTQIRSGASYVLRNVIDRYKRCAYAEDEDPTATLVVQEAHRAPSGEFIAKVGVAGTTFAVTVRYTET